MQIDENMTPEQILVELEVQSKYYRKKLAWRLYSEFYKKPDVLDIIGRHKSVSRALKAVAYDLYRAEKIYRAGFEAGLEEARKKA
jgi:hypothetical protein